MIDAALQAIVDLSRTRKLTEKRQVLLRNVDNTILADIFRRCENPRITYGVKKFTLCGGDTNLANSDSHYNAICMLLNRLSSRELTGGAAQTEISRVSSLVSPDLSNLLEKILNRNLRCSVGTSLIFQIWPNLYPRFGCQLADVASSIENIPLPCFASAKLDGVRNIQGIDGDCYRSWTRSGDLNHNLDYVNAEINPLISELGLTFDGEIMAANWNRTSSITRSSVNRPADDLIRTAKYYIFDCFPTAEFESDTFTETFSDRYSRLCKIFSDHKFEYVELVKHELITTHAELTEFYEKCLKEGYEGIVAKSPRGIYSLERTKSWLKYKPEETIDSTITGFKDGTGVIETIYLEPTDSMTNGLESEFGSVARAYMSTVREAVAKWDDETGGEYGFAAKLNDRLSTGGVVFDGVRSFKGAGAICVSGGFDCAGMTNALRILVPLFIEELSGLTLEMTGQKDFSGKESVSNFARYKRLRLDK